ncbi:MAG: recombinase family protein [Leptolyngbya sp. DLM2.Bin27]|nr:MAG: recombinase family protein [Leptolyngbya sp. DLM2.Bin27]
MTPPTNPGFGLSDKLQWSHLDRLAVVYVRQSTLQQVTDHQESTRLQYGLVTRAEALGWPPERILTIDEDLGKSGSSAEGRSGFQRLVSEVGLNHVGLILGVEMSRLARSCKDWHQLLEICALFGTLIADLDGIYDPSQYNDRLLLGLKGTMSEAELHLLKQRMMQGKRTKAQRGELGFNVPIGYIRRPSGVVQFDPDEQVRQVVRLIFRKFEELGTLNATLRYLVRHDIHVGVRVLCGLDKGELQWRRPNRPTLQNLLKNPAYAGAYAYGRKQVDARKKKAGRPHTGCVVKPTEEWLVLIQDHHPAYITWQQYQRNVAQLKANQNRADELGHAREGVGLLSGLLVCGRCGRRLQVQYHRTGGYHRYVCNRDMSDYGGPVCQHVSGTCLDEYVTTQVLRALEPAALELSLAAAAQLEQDRAELDILWQQRLERAQFDTDRARRHYQRVEPENRLVARQLAQDWEAALQAQHLLQEDYQRFCQEQPKGLSSEEKQQIQQLADSLPTLWTAPTTTLSQRKDVIRQMIDRILVTVVGDTEQVQVTIEWAGGDSSQAQITRPVAKWTQLSYYPQLCQRLEELNQANLTTDDIIDCLHQDGFRPPKRRQTFNPETVQTLIRRLGLRSHSAAPAKAPLPLPEWWLPDLAAKLDMPTTTLYNWVQRGWVKARQQAEPPKHWIIWADEAELKRLSTHRQRPNGDILKQRWQGETPSIACPPE